METPPAPRRILGIDPGINRTGYAILERGSRPVSLEGGVIRSSRAGTLGERVAEIGGGIRELIEQYQPDVVAIEKVFSTPRYPKTALVMAHARGAILFVVSDQKIPLVHYTPTQIKRMLTGSGHATKEQMQHAISTELNLNVILEPNDVADAFAIALCHYYVSSKLSSLF